MVSFRQSIGIASGSIKSAKMRSTLTTLGIIIGVAAVIANVSLGASFSQYFTDEIGAIGSNFIVIFSKEPNLFYDSEMELIKNTPGILGVSPMKQRTAVVTYLSTSRHIEVIGVSEDYYNTANLRMEEGSFITAKDSYAAVIGHDVAYDKFNKKVFTQNSIDISFQRNDGSKVTKKFIVKGILKGTEATLVHTGIEPEERIFIPISTMNELLRESDYGTFFAMASSIETVKETDKDVDKRLARYFGVSARDIDNDDAKPYSTMNQAEFLDQMNVISVALSGLLTAVALVSLIVGSIGIMNIMLVTVTERTREIGIMKSLGFTSYNVLSLFIVESIVLSIFGGLLGTVLGIAGAYAAQSAMKIPHIFPLELIAVGIGVSIIVGLIAGIYPANKAARMNPVEALRHHG